MSTKKVLDLEFKEVSKVRGKTVFSSPEQQERVVVEKIPDNLEAYSLTETVLEMQKLYDFECIGLTLSGANPKRNCVPHWQLSKGNWTTSPERPS